MIRYLNPLRPWERGAWPIVSMRFPYEASNNTFTSGAQARIEGPWTPWTYIRAHSRQHKRVDRNLSSSARTSRYIKSASAHVQYVNLCVRTAAHIISQQHVACGHFFFRIQNPAQNAEFSVKLWNIAYQRTLEQIEASS